MDYTLLLALLIAGYVLASTLLEVISWVKAHRHVTAFKKKENTAIRKFLAIPAVVCYIAAGVILGPILGITNWPLSFAAWATVESGIKTAVEKTMEWLSKRVHWK